METKSITYLNTKVDQDGVIIGQTEKVEFETFNSKGAIFFQKESRGFVIPINRFSAELTSSDIEKFTRLFFGSYAAAGTNRMELPGTRRKSKEMDRAELAEAMGFEGKTAVTKATGLLNKLISLSVMAKKMNGRVEEWYINPLLIKTSHRLSVDLFELFQPSLEEAMAKQVMILSFLKAGVREKYISQVTTMSHAIAKKEIEKEQYKEKFLTDMDYETPVTAVKAHEEIIEEAVGNYPQVHFYKPTKPLTAEETRNTLRLLKDSSADDLEAATSGIIRHTKKASAPTEAKRIS